MTKKEKLMQDIQYAIDYKVPRFYIKREAEGFKGLNTTIYCNCDFEKVKEDLENFESKDLTYDNGRIVSWGEFSVSEDKYIKYVLLGDKKGEDIYKIKNERHRK